MSPGAPRPAPPVGWPERPTAAQPEEEASMTVASDLLRQHIQTLVADNKRWQTLIADDLVWELPYGPGIGDPARLAGREEVMRHVTWFLGAVENARFFDLQVHALGGKIAFLREYFDPTRAAKAMNKPILGS